MAILKNTLSALILSVLVATGVQAMEPPPGDFGLTACDATSATSGGTVDGNQLTTCKLIVMERRHSSINTKQTSVVPWAY